MIWGNTAWPITYLDVHAYEVKLSSSNTAIINDFKFALSRAEVDPNTASKLIESLQNTLPKKFLGKFDK